MRFASGFDKKEIAKVRNERNQLSDQFDRLMLNKSNPDKTWQSLKSKKSDSVKKFGKVTLRIVDGDS